MPTLKRIVSFSVFVALAVLVTASDPNENCSNSKCMVRSPFRSSDQPITCGLPGFNLLCTIPYNKPLLSFPSSGHTFSVDYIYYYSKLITLSDPQRCLQKKLLGFDSTGTPFRFEDPTYFPLYNCSRSSKLPSSYSGLMIGCLSGSNYSVVWDKYYSLSKIYGCDFIGDAMGPGDWASYTYQFSNADSVDMAWDLPDGCLRCLYGDCQRDPNDVKRVTCPASTVTKNNSDYIKIILPTVISVILVLVGVCYLLLRIASRAAEGASIGLVDNNNTMEQSHLDATSTTNRQSTVLPSGVEQDILDAYPTMVVGGSGRILVNMEDKTCPICLSEYKPRDTLKTMPECLHKFHSDCIDEWLRAKALCPVCRTPPPRTLS